MKKLTLFAIAALLCTLAIAQTVPGNNYFTRVIPPAAYTAAEVDSVTQTNLTGSGAQIVINCTTYTSGNYTPHVQGIDPDGTAYDILVGTVGSSTVVSGTGKIILYVGKGYLAIPGVSAQTQLPLKWRVILVGASTPNMFLVVNANVGI